MQRYFAISKNENEFKLKDEDFYHIRTVMRMTDKDKIEVVYEEVPYLCSLADVKENMKVKILKEIEQRISNIPEVTLVLPILKEQKFDFILQKSAELGITKIIPVTTERSIVKLNDSKETKKLDRWNRIVKEASEQSNRINIPIITEVKSLKELTKLEGLTILCSTRERNNNINFLLKNNKDCDKINIVIGPEGGLSEKEEEYLKSIGAISTTLGANIMRVETVPIFVLSIINYEYME